MEHLRPHRGRYLANMREKLLEVAKDTGLPPLNLVVHTDTEIVRWNSRTGEVTAYPRTMSGWGMPRRDTAVHAYDSRNPATLRDYHLYGAFMRADVPQYKGDDE